MKWTEVLEQRKALLVGGIAVVCLAALLVSARRFNFSLDVFWHAKTGIDWLFNGLSPWKDHYSFTFYGEPIKSQAWVFQVIVGWLVHQFGVESGLEILRMACWLAVLGLVLVFLRRLKSPTLVYLVVLPMVTLLLQQRPVSRPELISYILIVVGIMLYYRARLKMSPATMLPIVLLAWLWNNYHSAVFFYVIFFGLFIDTAVRYLRDREDLGQWLKWMAWGMAVLGVGALKPGFQIPFLGMLFSSPDTFSGEWKALILEYTPLASRLAKGALVFNLSIFALGTIAAITLLLAGLRQYFGMLISCAVLVFYAIDISRLLTPNGIALLCFFAWIIQERDAIAWIRRLPGWSVRIVQFTVLSIFVLNMYNVVSLAQQSMAMNRTVTTGFPKDVTDYMIENNIGGRIFNEYEHGGYLIYRLAPDSRVYIDGRTNILYPVEHAKHSLETRKTPRALAEEIRKYDIQLALLNNSKHNYTLVLDTNLLQLDYVGFEHSLFRKDSPNFPVHGKLLAQPACWSADKLPALLAERNKALGTLPGRSPLIDFSGLLVDYANTPERKLFLEQVESLEEWNDYMLRFAGYQALVNGASERGLEFFARLRDMEFADFLAVALIRVSQGDWEKAESVLDSLTRTKWPAVKQFELEILYRLLQLIRREAGLELFDDTYLEGLAQQFPESGEGIAVPDVDSFCPKG